MRDGPIRDGPQRDGQGRRQGVGRVDRGFALLIVLWSIALLALIGAHVTGTGRAEAQLAGNLRSAARAEAAADGLLYEAIFHLLLPAPGGWPADGIPREIALPGRIVATLRIESEQGKLNPNLATAGQLQALLQGLGLAPRPAMALAAAMLDWRTAARTARPNGAKEAEYRAAGLGYAPPGRPFESLDDMQLVLGMTPELLARLKPVLSIYQDGEPDLRIEPAAILQAMLESGSELEAAPDPGTAPTVLITAAVRLPDGAAFTRQAHVRLGPGAQGRAWRILTWQTAEE